MNSAFADRTAPEDSVSRVAVGAAPFVPRVVSDWLRDLPQLRHQRLVGGLVFVDVSGFTAMSERLASLGREGAERVTEIIDGAFERLLDEAYRQGGSLLKFGGDALLLYFGDDEPATRAAVTAHHMRRVLAQVGRIDTPAGAVQLRCSIGVHAGALDFFLVGTSHRELILAGPGASAVMRAEASAGADNIVLTDDAVALLPAASIGEPHGAGTLLAACPPEPPSVPLRTMESAAYQWRAVSTALRRHLVDDGRDVAEHRRAVVGFLHFEDTDELVAHHGPDSAAGALHQLVTTVQHAADEQGLCVLASDIDIDGGKIILTGGVPVAHTDDVDRMLLAMRRIVDARPRIPIRIGVHQGPLFAGEVGPAHRRTYTVMGDVVNTAARVMSRAGAYEVYVTDETLAQATIPFEATSIPPFEVKGKAEPLRASSIGRQLAQEGSIGRSARRTLIGREDELADVLRRFDAARRGEGSTLELVGPSGVGKTEILRGLIGTRELESDRVVVVRAQRATAHVAYGPVRSTTLSLLGLSVNAGPELIRTELRSAITGLDPTFARHAEPMLRMLGVAGSMADEVDPRSFRADVAAAIDDLLTALFPDGVLIVVENAQWLDESSVDLLRALASRSTDRPWFIGATGWHTAPILGGTRRELPPLDEFHGTELALVESGHRLLPSQANEIARRAEGNALFIVELVAVALASGEDAAELPASLEQLLAARIDQLPPGDRSFLRQLSVLGATLEVDEALAFLGMTADELSAKVADLAEFVTEFEGVVRFRETLLPDAAYGGLSYRRRRELHRRAGELLETRLDDPTSRAGTLARHFDGAGDHERTWTYACAAAEQSAGQAGYAEAIEFYQRALRAASTARQVAPTDRGRVMHQLGRALVRIGRIAEGEQVFERASRFVDDELTRAVLLIDRAGSARGLGRSLSAVRRLKRALRILDTLDDSPDVHTRVADAHLSLAMNRLEHGRLPEALEHAEQARRSALRSGRNALVARSLQVRFVVASGRREPGAEALAREAIERFDQERRPRDAAHVRNALGTYLEALGDLDGAEEAWRDARDTLQQLGLSMDEAIVGHNLADMLFLRGDFAGARHAFERSVAVFETLEHPYAPVGRLMRLFCLGKLGQLPEGAEVDHELEELRGAGLGLLADEATTKWCDCLLDQARYTEARAMLDRVAGSDDPSVQLVVPRLRARHLLGAGAVDEARDQAVAAVSVAVEACDPRNEGEARAVLADVLDALDEDGTDSRAKADALLASLGVRPGTFGRPAPTEAVGPR